MTLRELKIHIKQTIKKLGEDIDDEAKYNIFLCKKKILNIF
jgi:hypothetical protein